MPSVKVRRMLVFMHIIYCEMHHIIFVFVIVF